MLNLKRLRKREKLFLGLWLAVVAGLLLKAGADRLIGDSRRLNAEIAARQARLVKLQRLLKHAEAINAAYARTVTRTQSLKDSGSLIQGIENLARKAGVNLVNLKPMQMKESGRDVSALRVEVQDSISAIARFFSMVNRELSGVGVERVQIFTQNREEPPHAAFLVTMAEEEDHG